MSALRIGVNVVLYAATAVAVFWLASAMLPVPAAWLAGALFAVHPVHVEAVANVVGQAELWVALLVLLAAGQYVHRRNAGAFDVNDATLVGALFITGAADWGAYQTPGALEAMQIRACRDFRGVRVIDGAGHWVQQEQPNEVSWSLVQFLRGAKAN